MDEKQEEGTKLFHVRDIFTERSYNIETMHYRFH